MAAEAGDASDPADCNPAEFCRRTGLSRSRARTIKGHGFKVLPHGNSGRRAATTVLTGHTGLVDDLLRKGVTNSQVIFDRLRAQGYGGGLAIVKAYVAANRDLVPAKRRRVPPQGNRGRRYETAPGEASQMDWGFVGIHLLEPMEARYGTASTVFCTQFRQKDWRARLGGGVHADAIMERIVHGAAWVEMGEMNMRRKLGAGFE